MTAANLSFAVPTASSLPTLSASQPTGTSVQNGDRSFSQMLQSRENASPSAATATQSAQSADKNGPADNAGKQPADAHDKTSSRTARDQQSSPETPQEAAQQAAQAPQPGMPKPSLKTGMDSATLLEDTTSSEDPDAGLEIQPDASLLAAMAAANLAAQPASNAGKALPTELQGGMTTATSLTDESTGLLLEDPVEGGGGNAKALFELTAAAETITKPETTGATNKDSSFNAALTSALDNQSGPQPPTGQIGMQTGTVQTTETSTRQVVSTPVATQGWTEEVGHKVSWAASNGNGRAELILTPAHMGRIEVSINLNGDQASANFVAANAATREALQDAMPQLREVLAGAGIQLGQANVSANSGGQAWTGGSGQSSFNSGTYSTNADSATDNTVDALTGPSRGAWVLNGNGLVDIFA